MHRNMCCGRGGGGGGGGDASGGWTEYGNLHCVMVVVFFLEQWCKYMQHLQHTQQAGTVGNMTRIGTQTEFVLILPQHYLSV